MRHLAQARNPYSLSWLWIPGSRGACHRAALCADPLARPGMTVHKLHLHHFKIEQRFVRVRNKPSLTGIETDQLARNRRRCCHGTLFVVVADRCPASHSGLDLRVRRFALEFDAAKKRPRSVAAFRVDGARIERARMGASSASRVFQRPFWLLQGTRQRER
jgi:hypothetical protein